MATPIIMPKAGMAMEEGTVIKWFKAEGEKVEEGEPLLEILTDKVNMEVEAQTSGVLLKIIKHEGEVVPVTNIIGYIGKVGEQINAPTAEKALETKASKEENKTDEAEMKKAKFQTVAGKVAATPAARRIALERNIDLNKLAGTGSQGEIKARDVIAFKNTTVTPLAKRIADANAINLESVTGSGHKGKIMKQDIISKLNVEEKAPALEQVKTGTPLKGIRKVIADRMFKSHMEIPSVTLNAKSDVTELSGLREKFSKKANVKLTYNDFVLKAVATALKEHPEINTSLIGDEIIYKEEINIGVAVATDAGLTVPVIKGADNASIKYISNKSKELSGKAREGKLTLEDLTGGTFTVSNLGMYDILSFTPIINQPECAILGVCAIEEELKMIEGKIEARKMMGLSLTFDHRIIDGAVGAVFLRRIKELLENPIVMLL